tara:strand:- start:248 stop:1174 length:927 start_codon:yes stop_codon:yes gene_type:complete
VYAEGQLVVRKGDAYVAHACPGSPPHNATASAGSASVFINGEPAHREGDAISCGSKGANGASTVIMGNEAPAATPVVTVNGTGSAPGIETSEAQNNALGYELSRAAPDVGNSGGMVEQFYQPTPDAGGTDALGTTEGLVQPANSSATADQIPAFLSQLLVEAGNNQWDETVNPSNSNIIGIWQDLGFPNTSYWQTDQTPWCAGFVNWVLKSTGYKFMQSARAYDFRDKTSLYGGTPVPKSDGQPGDIVVWNYSHVNFIYTVTSPGVYRFVGGNQSDRATGDNNPSGGTITNNGGRASRISGIFRPVRA